VLLFPEVKIKGLSANTGKREILPQRAALRWNQSLQPAEEAGAERSPLPVARSPPGVQAGQAAHSQQQLPAGQGGGEEPRRHPHNLDLILQKMMDIGVGA